MVKSKSLVRDVRILESVKKKRGYVLPYHELFWCIDPKLLAKYDAFYEHLTLMTNHLDARTKELVWIGILICASEEAGTLHLKRAREAGVTDEEIRDVISIAYLARGFDTLIFVADKWKGYLPEIDVMGQYAKLIDSFMKEMTLSKRVAELVFIGAYSALPIPRALRWHLIRAKQEGVRDEEIAEAVSFIFIPRGGNQLIEVAQVLKDAVQHRELEPDSSFDYWLEETR